MIVIVMSLPLCLFIYAFGAYSGAWTVIVLLVSLQDGMKLNYHLFKRTLTIIFCFFFLLSVLEIMFTRSDVPLMACG